jgi:zinc protease
LIENAMKRAYTLHPYRWPIIGSMAHLDAAVESDYVNFYKTFYVPNNAILSIAGDMTIEETKKLVSKYFGDIPKGKGEVFRSKVVEPALTKEIRDTIYDNVQLPMVAHTYRIPANGTPDFYAVSLLAQLLSKGESSRLNKALVDEQQKALNVGAFPIDMEDPGVTLIYGISNMGVDPGEMEKAMDAEIEKVQKELIGEEEFQKLKNQIENDFVSSNSTIAGIAESLANYKMYLGDTNLINEEINRFNKVTKY